MHCATSVLALLLCVVSVVVGQGQGQGQQERTIRCDLAVIGGGAGGANAAMFYKLKNASKTVCLLEKESFLGGHCQTVPNPTGWSELGVQAVINTTQANLLGYGNFSLKTDTYMASLGVGLFGVDFTSAPQIPLVVDIGKRSGLNFPQAPADPVAYQTAFGTALFTLINTLNVQYPWLSSATWPDPIPQELLGNFESWLNATEEYKILVPVFNALLTVSGLGPWNQLTTVYALQAMDPAILALFTPSKGGMGVIFGCSAFYQNLGAALGTSSVFLSTEIKSVKRDVGEPIVIKGKVGGVQTTFNADKLIVAIPPTPANSQLIGFDPDALEVAAFGTVQVRNYYTTLARFAGPLVAGKSVALVNTDNNNPFGQPSYPSLVNCDNFVPTSPGACKGVSLSYVNAAVFQSTTVQPSLVNISTAPSLNPGSFNVTTVGPTILHVYQPHFPVSSLTASPNPYTRIANLQGHRNTFYVGALMTFANTARIMDHAYRIVTQFL